MYFVQLRIAPENPKTPLIQTKNNLIRISLLYKSLQLGHNNFWLSVSNHNTWRLYLLRFLITQSILGRP